MRKFLIAGAVLLALCSCSQKISWKRTLMKASRTGVEACTADNVSEKLGVIDGAVYKAPNGREFAEGSSTYAVAKLLIEAQPAMRDLKEVVGYSTRVMVREYPECELSDWFIDELMRAAEEKSGKKVDFGVTNFGGIRVDMPEGDVLMDDIVSMFPFKNNLCFLELYGRDIRALLEQLASTSWQVVGGARCVVQDGKLVSAEIGGEPIDDDKIYGVATISFLLNGGDGLFVARNAVSLQMYDEYILDVMLPCVQRLTEEGKPIEYQMDGRIQILKSEDNATEEVRS
ncbi:MAG: 5'-nucleotidase C-terminal domain-containing protein [Bacteroidales bacterium]|nr:5'-nucleotidase C-terminal domain-containing protein [Bacteroidales bacterium]